MKISEYLEKSEFSMDLPFTGPITNAAGMLGFHPNPRGLDLTGLGGFITNPISLDSRTAAGGTRLVHVPAGALLHTGHPNRGARTVIRKYRSHWRRSDLPVVAHLLAGDPDELYRLVRMFEETEGVTGIEVGIPPGAARTLVRDLVQAAIGELPVITRVPIDQVRGMIGEAADAGSSALSFGPALGASPDAGGRTTSGRLYGPGVYPFAFEVLQDVVGGGIPVIFAGGLWNRAQIDTALEAGAAGVQIDLRLWNPDPFNVPI